MKNSVGGKLQGISLDAFLQMAQMEEITCTLSVISGNRTGRLFLRDGKLISAETDGYSELEAAQRIISWEKTAIDITESCSKTDDKIKQPLMNVLMEAMRLRDDAENNPPHEAQPDDNQESNASADKPEKAASSEKESPGTGTAVTPQKAESPLDQPDPGKKAIVGDGKQPVVSGAGITPNPKGRSKRLPWKLLLACLAVLLVTGGLITYFISNAKQNRLAYEAFALGVKKAETSEQKLDLLNAYIRKNPNSPYSEEVLKQIKTHMTALDEQAFEAIKTTASQLAADGDLEAAAGVYEKYLEENRGSRHAGSASAALKVLSKQMGNRAFKEMQAAAGAIGPERIFLYRDFLEQYADSDHRKEVLALISGMEDEFFVYVERKVQEYEKDRNWGESIKIGRQYLDIYPVSDHAEAVTKWLVIYRDKYQASLSFEQLSKRADSYGTDHDAALAVFSDYLKAYPGTPVREKIEQEIDRLYALSEQKRLLEAKTRMAREILSAGSRFSVENNETVLDTKTGLMWCLLDSRVTEKRCLTYEEATAHVSSLETGGHDDWRLPNPKELMALYGKPPAFPYDADTWYWSSKNEKRYADQWIIDVQVIDPNNTDENTPLLKESWRCGTVRAVRQAK